MKRRFFVQTAACTTLGAGIPLHGALSQVVDQGSASLMTRLQRAEWSFLVQRRSKALRGADSLHAAVAARCEFLAGQGYVRATPQAYFFGIHEEFSFLPVIKQNTGSAPTDVLLPVFRQDADLQWHYAHTLTGFQLEAMLYASQALRLSGPAALQRLLLPIGKNGVHDSTGTYRTQAGRVDMVTHVKKGVCTTTCTVHHDDGVLFSDTFTHV